MLGNARLRLFVRAVIGVALLGWLAQRTGLGPDVVETPVRTLLALGTASLLLAVGQALSAWRWQILLGPDAPRWLDLFRIYMIGQFAGLFLPTSVGGDVVRVAAVSRVRPAALTISSVLLDRGLGLAALLVYLLLGLVLAPSGAAGVRDAPGVDLSLPWLLGAGAVGLGLTGLVAVSPVFRRVRTLARDTLRTAVRTFLDEPGRAAAATLISFLVQGVYIVAWTAAGAGVGLSLPPLFMLVAVPLVSLVSMIPVTIHGLGVREGVWALLLAPLGVEAAAGVALGILFFAAFALVGAGGGVWLAVRGVDVSRGPLPPAGPRPLGPRQGRR